MMASFRETFFPTKEEQIKSLEKFIELHNEQIGHCSTCAFHEPTDAPGFVTDYGSCRADSPIFAKKVCGLEEIDCSSYEEDFSIINLAKDSLAELKGEG